MWTAVVAEAIWRAGCMCLNVLSFESLRLLNRTVYNVECVVSFQHRASVRRSSVLWFNGSAKLDGRNVRYFPLVRTRRKTHCSLQQRLSTRGPQVVPEGSKNSVDCTVSISWCYIDASFKIFRYIFYFQSEVKHNENELYFLFICKLVRFLFNPNVWGNFREGIHFTRKVHKNCLTLFKLQSPFLMSAKC